MQTSTFIGIIIMIVLGAIAFYWVWLFSMGITFWSTVTLLPFWVPVTGAIIIGILCAYYLFTTKKNPK